jgi:hydrogenase/urease accessory protein HupE
LTRVGIALGVVCVLATLARAAFAHDPFEITSVVRVGADGLVVETTMARSTALRVATGEHRIGMSLPPEEFSAYRSKLERVAPSFVEIASDGEPLRPRSASATLSSEDDVEMVVTHDPPTGMALRARAGHLREVPDGYTHALSVVDGVTNELLGYKVLTASDPAIEISLPIRAAQRDRAATPSKPAEFREFLLLGVEHVLTGYDHLLFLCGILLGCRGVKSLFSLVTCFTAAHSITLALAVFGQLSVPVEVVEPLIALSIVIVGLENLSLPSKLARRLALTFVLGLVHGLGFAGALGDLSLHGRALLLPLFSFNLGIEFAQVAVSALSFALILKLRQTPIGNRGLRVASVVVAAMGFFWLCQRMIVPA